jgi:uncharacterized protein YgbK (DUF1537 family)
MEALGVPCSFITPAFPDQNRTTIEGIHCIQGVPVAETEIGRDPLTPVTESFLPKWISAQTRWPVAHIGLKTLVADREAVADEITKLRARGVRHISFDATEIGHLDRIAQLALEYFPDILPCGSAGLARSLARQLGASNSKGEKPGKIPPDPLFQRGRTTTLAPPFQRGGCESSDRVMEPLLTKRASSGPDRPDAGMHSAAGSFLFVCGSASQTLRLQVSELAENANVAVETLEADALVGDQARAGKAAILGRAAAALSKGDLVLQLTEPGIGQGPVEPRQLVEKLSEFAAKLIDTVKPAVLFLSGGDTAIALLERLRAKAVRLESEIPGGLVYGTLLGGPMSDRPVITKAGAFGSPDALLNLHRMIRRRP